MSFPVWNSDPSWNKITSSYFRDNIDLSGNFIIRNGTIRSPANEIQFDDTYAFTNFVNSVNVFGQLKNTYNSVEYDVGLQCEKTDQVVADVGTISPIVYDTAFKCTNFYYDQSSNSTVWSGLLTCPIASIASTAIANTTRFIEGTGNQNVGGIKRFTSNIRIDLGIIVNNNTLTITNAQLQLIPNIGTLNTKTTNISFATNTTTISNTTNLTDINFTGNINNTFTKAQFDTAINFSKSATSDLQSQITTLSNNSVSLSASNIFTGATNQFSNSLRLDGTLVLNSNALTLTNANLQKIQYLSTVSSDVQTQITAVETRATTLETKTTKMSYMSVGGINTTTFNDGLISQRLSFTNTLNNITPTTFGYISGLTSSAQTQLNDLKTKTDTTNVNVATLTTNVNDFAQRTTEMSYSDDPTPQTNITNKTVLEEVVFTTDLNSITPTTFAYLSGVSSNIQTQLNSKIDSIVGTIIQHVSGNLQTNYPTRFLLCNGQAVSRTGTYANLFAMIGTTYGSGDGSTFNVPDFTACFLRGAGSSRTFGGVVYTPPLVGTIQQDSMEAHVHSSNLSGSYLNNSTTNGSYFSFGTSRYNTTNFPTFGGGVSASHRTTSETRPLNHAVYFYISC